MSRPLVVITGGAGFIGRAVRRRLAAHYTLHSVDLREHPPMSEHERTEVVDLGDPLQVFRFWRGLGKQRSRLHGIVHLAAYYDFSGRPDRRYLRLLRGLSAWLPMIAEDAPPGAVLAFGSSMAALEPTRPGVPLTAASPRHAGWAYPASKVATEQLLAQARIPQTVVELVLAAVYSDDCELVPLYQTLELIRSRSPEKYFYPGPVDRGLTYLHRDEAAEAFARVLDRYPRRGGHHRLLIGQHQPTTYAQIHQRASRAFHGRVLPLWHIPRPVARVGATLLGGVDRFRRRRRFIQPWMIRYAGEHFEFDLHATQQALGWVPSRHLLGDLDPMLERARAARQHWQERNQQRPW